MSTSNFDKKSLDHYSDVIMGAMTSQITSLMIVYSNFHSGADQRRHQSSASLAFVQGINRWPVNFPHKWPVTRKIFPFDDVILFYVYIYFGFVYVQVIYLLPVHLQKYYIINCVTQLESIGVMNIRNVALTYMIDVDRYFKHEYWKCSMSI